MKNIGKYVLAFLAGALVVFIGFSLVGNNQSGQYGGPIGVSSITRYPNGGLAARFLYIGTTMPTTAQTDGSITSTGAATFSGTSAFTGTTRIQAPVITAATKVTLTSGATTSTITGAQVCAGDYVEWNPSVTNASATLPSAAALTCLTTNGDNLSIVFKNTAATATGTVAFVAGASTTLVYSSASTTAGYTNPVLQNGGYMRLQFLEASSSDSSSQVTVLANQFK